MALLLSVDVLRLSENHNLFWEIFGNFVVTSVEKDIRQALNITDVHTFQRFLKLCAARIGNLLLQMIVILSHILRKGVYLF